MANSALARQTVVLTHTASPSGASDVTFTGLSSAYAYYVIHIVDLDPSADCNLLLQTSTDGGSTYDSSAGNYAYAVLVSAAGAVSTANSTSATSIALVTSGGGTGTNESIAGTVTLHNPSVADYAMITWDLVSHTTAGALKSGIGAGARLTAADVDAIKIYPSTGTITGEIRVYGHKAAA